MRVPVATVPPTPSKRASAGGEDDPDVRKTYLRTKQSSAGPMRQMEDPKQTVINILTAMHVDKRDPLTLRSLMAAFAGYKVRHFVSVSGDCPSAFCSKSIQDGDYSLRITRREGRWAQMRHLAQIVRELSFADEDLLLFCDDDDLILSPPEGLERLISGEIPAIKGLQYLMADEKSTFADVKEAGANGFLQTHCEVATDFTGHMTSFRLVKEFFASYAPLAEPARSESNSHTGTTGLSLNRVRMILGRASDRLADTAIMRLLDEAGAHIPKSPFVWHRVRARSGGWKETILEDLDRLNRLLGPLLDD